MRKGPIQEEAVGHPVPHDVGDQADHRVTHNRRILEVGDPLNGLGAHREQEVVHTTTAWHGGMNNRRRASTSRRAPEELTDAANKLTASGMTFSVLQLCAKTTGQSA